MAHISCRWTEDVSGVIIGDISHTGCLMYKNRRQTENFHSNKEDGLIDLAKKRYEWIKSDMGESFKDIYPEDEFWLKIFTD